MANGIWTYAHLTPEQERELKEAEKQISNGALLAFTEVPTMPSQLNQDQMQRLEDFQKKTGLVVVAVKPQ